jgi:GH43 family beta-xylosidase
MKIRFNSHKVILTCMGLAVLLAIGLGAGCSPMSLPPLQTASASTPSTSLPTQSAAFYNPLNSSGPDPWMTYYDGYYYLAATTMGNASVGLTMRKAATIEELKRARPVQVFRDLTVSRCCNYWAPEFYLLDGPDGPRWYGYYSGGPENCCDGQRMHVIESAGTDPLGPYTYKGQLTDSIGGWAIDTSVLQLNDALYLLFSAFPGSDISAITNDQNLYIASMSNPWTLSGDRVLLSSPTYDWERQDGNVNEGPVALHHDGRTFIVYSASGCWGPNYKLGMLMYNGGDPLDAGSWVKSSKPVFQGTKQVFSPGHNNFFKSPDGREDWIIYHANVTANGSCDMNRSPRIQKISWNSDGTPDLGRPVDPGTEIPIPAE